MLINTNGLKTQLGYLRLTAPLFMPMTPTLFCLGANHRYKLMNDISKKTPIKQVPETDKFSHPQLTTGKPYQL